MLITKTYWKWDKAYNDERFNLGDRITASDISNELILEESNNESARKIYQLKANPTVFIITNTENEIVCKRFSMGATIGDFKVRPEMSAIIHAEIQEFLEPSEVGIHEDKLMAIFGDWLLKSIIVVTKNMNLPSVSPSNSTLEGDKSSGRKSK